jgi:drug/metabolite transporter (DMT)-like permease
MVGMMLSQTARTGSMEPRMSQNDRPMLPLAVLALALLGVAFGSIFVRLAGAPALAMAAWRVGIAALLVVPLAWAQNSGPVPAVAQRQALAAGLLLALHFATWIQSLAYLSVSASVVLVTTSPVWVVVLSWLFRLGAPHPRQLAAVALSVVGSVIIGGASLLAGLASFRGALLALAGAVCMGGYLLLARACQRHLGFLAFVARSYGTAALALWIAAVASGTPMVGFPPRTWLCFAGAALASQLIGHGGYNWALRHLDPVFVGIVLVGEPVLASALAWWLFGESVAPSTWVGGALILAGVATGFGANPVADRNRQAARTT